MPFGRHSRLCVARFAGCALGVLRIVASACHRQGAVHVAVSRDMGGSNHRGTSIRLGSADMGHKEIRRVEDGGMGQHFRLARWSLLRTVGYRVGTVPRGSGL